MVSKISTARCVMRRVGLRVMGFLVVAIGLPANSTRWPSCRLDGFHVEAEPLQRANHKRPRGQFVLQQWVISRARRFGTDHFAFVVDSLTAPFGTIKRLTCAGQHFQSTGIVD